MANLYLMQALYAPKPPTPTVKPEVSAIDEGEIRQQSETATSEQTIHDARRRLMESEEPIEVDYEVPERWEPTGANMQPVGIKSDSPECRSATPVRSFPPLHDIVAITPSSPLPMTLRDGLMYPIERYLPPAGLYYDQPALIAIFGASFFKYGYCTICWSRHPSAGFSATSCGKKCKICGTQRHKHESCPLFYCNTQWYQEQNIPYSLETLRSRQIRPNKEEFAILCRIGVISEEKGANGILVAKADHPLVQAFYRGKPSSKAMMRKIFDADQRHRAMYNMTPARPSLVASAHSQQPLPPPMRPYNVSRTVVNSSLDPRLPGHNAFDVPARSASAQPDTTAAHDHASAADSQDTETKLQEQEVEILNLRMQAVVKDREIRRLKAEIEQLRAHAANTGVAY